MGDKIRSDHMMNPKEIEVLKILMHAEEPMSLPDFFKVEPALVKSTVAAALAKLLREGNIEVVGIAYSGKAICRTYRPTAQAKDALQNSITSGYNGISEFVSIPEMCMSLLKLNKDPKTAKEELAELKKLLDQYEKENGFGKAKK